MGVNHIQAHVAALYIDEPTPAFPLLILVVSGGHTQLVLAKDFTDMEIVGTTLDDAAGEAFDKAAKLLGLPYPGGPQIEKIAKHGNPELYSFPKASVPGLNMSFSGIKTSLLYFLQKETNTAPSFAADNLSDICASYQHCIVDYLIGKAGKAIGIYKPGSIALAGGVSANRYLRMRWHQLAEDSGLPCLVPDFEYCTDNAAMICMAGHFLLEQGHYLPLDSLPYSKSKP